jgi:hypothetical protein
MLSHDRGMPRAVVHLPTPACGSGYDEPGVYLVGLGGSIRSLVVAVPSPRYARAFMWGSA